MDTNNVTESAHESDLFKNEKDVIDILGVLSLEDLAQNAKTKETEVNRKKQEEEKMYEDTAIGAVIRKIFRNIKRTKYEILIALFYALMLSNMAFVLIQSIWEFQSLSSKIQLWMHPVLVLLEIVLPMIVWAFSTAFDTYNYHNLKKFTFSLCVANWLLLMWNYFRIAILQGVKIILFSIPTSGVIKPHVIVWSTYAIAGGVLVVLLAFVAFRIYKNLKEPLMQRAIIRFRIKKIIPYLPWGRRFNYDLFILRNLQTGAKYIIYEADRRLHFKGVGSTGSGKTATLLKVSFERDLRQLVHNIDYLKKKVSKLLKKGLVVMNRNFDDVDFDMEYISAAEGRKKEKTEKELKKLQEKVKIMGHTIMCPNEAFCNELYDLVKAKGLKVNRIDPCVGEDGEFKPDWIGFNPIYVPIVPGETTEAYLFRVFTAARLYSDVNQAIFELSGKGDPYFTGLNRNISVSGAIIVIIGHPLLYPGEYATPEQVQKVINDFTAVKAYRDVVIDKYGIPNPAGIITKEIGRAKVITELQFIIDRIDRDFLGPNAPEINKQATGLRNIIDESLMNPRIRRILCAKETINLDRALEKGELTLVNFEISLGSDSTGFGMFFMISFIQAVLRRPGTLETRRPHEFAIDEAPMLFHPRIELSTTLFRQYNVSMMLFMQSLTQYDKNDMTRYLKNVLTGNCGHQIIFGRASLEEMRFYQELSGMTPEITESEQVRETALSDENTGMQFSHSSTLEEKETIAADDIRYREFLECTVLSTKDSTPVPPFLGKTHFLHRGYDPRMRRYRVDWSKYYIGQDAVDEEPTLEFKTSVSAKTNIVTRKSAPLFTSGKQEEAPAAEAEESKEPAEATSASEEKTVSSSVTVHESVKNMTGAGNTATLVEASNNENNEEGEIF